MTGKMLLKEYLREKVQSEYGSVPEASRVIGIPYERFKNALRSNNFRASDLSLIFPERSKEDIEKEFTFEIARKYQNHPNTASTSFADTLRKSGLDDADENFILENQAVARRIAAVIDRECEELRKILCDVPGVT